jgi:hypothetical protein
MSVFFGTHPANIPQFYLFYSGGLYYYGSSCCVPPEHWGVVVSTKFLTPDQLGCHPTPIPSTSPLSESDPESTSNPPPVAVEAKGPTPTLTRTTPSWPQNVPLNIYAMDNIGNANPLRPTDITYSLHGVTLKKVTPEVQFKAAEPDAAHIRGHIYKLSHFEINYFKTGRCSCPPETKKNNINTQDGSNQSQQSRTSLDDDIEHSDKTTNNHACPILVNYHLLLAEYVKDGDLDSNIHVAVEHSPEWPDKTDPKNNIAAGRLLRLTGTCDEDDCQKEAEYLGATILVVNAV